jgi:flagellar basal-body rod protein FlgB
MFTNLSILNDAQAMARHAAARQTIVAENIANVDSAGYKSRDIADFKTAMNSTSSMVAMARSRSGHMAASDRIAEFKVIQDNTAVQSPDGNGVEVENEMLKSIESERQHSRAITIYQTSINILRTSIGRGR